MKKRPTIPDLAAAAGVSVSTVNRVINAADSVRQPTRERVYHAAQTIGFYGLGSIEHAVKQGFETHRLGVLLSQNGRHFYENLAKALRKAARDYPKGRVELEIEFLNDLSADFAAARLTRMSEQAEAVGVVAAEHPILSEAIDRSLDQGVPVVGLIGELSARGNVGFVGLDGWKVGRTAAWAFDKMVRDPGKIGILVGNLRYRNQEVNEIGFRSYFREHNAGFTLLEPVSTYESAAVARDVTEKLFADHPDLCGLFISGGGITGALEALRECKRRPDFVSVGYELFDATRAALIDGRLNFVISHPLDRFAREIIATMIKAKHAGTAAGAQNVTLGFELYTPENV